MYEVRGCPPSTLSKSDRHRKQETSHGQAGPESGARHGRVARDRGGGRAAAGGRLAAVAVTYTRGREPAERLVKEIEGAGGRGAGQKIRKADMAKSRAVKMPRFRKLAGPPLLCQPRRRSFPTSWEADQKTRPLSCFVLAKRIARSAGPPPART